MGMQINTNIAALNAYRNLSSTQNDLSKSLEKLSSGIRINRAADYAAGLAISEGLRAQIGGLTVAARNAQDGISVIQTAEGALTEVHSILQRMRDLAVQAGNDSNSTEARSAIGTEAGALVSELDRIADSTNFNGIKLLDGTAGAAGNGVLAFQVGADGDASSQIQVSLASANVSTVVNTLNGVDAAGAALKGAVQNAGVTVAATTVNGDYTIAQAGGASITVSFGSASGTRTNADVLTTLQAAAGTSFTVTADSTAGKYTIVSNDTTLTDAATNEVTTTAVATASGMSTGTAGNAAGPVKLDFSSATGAQAAIIAINKQITGISTSRAALGAVQNRFESAINTLNVSKENISAAESRIRDTDMASEMVSYTRSNLLSQAGTAMLAQANQSNSGVLQLLQ